MTKVLNRLGAKASWQSEMDISSYRCRRELQVGHWRNRKAHRGARSCRDGADAIKVDQTLQRQRVVLRKGIMNAAIGSVSGHLATRNGRPLSLSNFNDNSPLWP